MEVLEMRRGGEGGEGVPRCKVRWIVELGR